MKNPELNAPPAIKMVDNIHRGPLPTGQTIRKIMEEKRVLRDQNCKYPNDLSMANIANTIGYLIEVYDNYSNITMNLTKMKKESLKEIGTLFSFLPELFNSIGKQPRFESAYHDRLNESRRQKVYNDFLEAAILMGELLLGSIEGGDPIEKNLEEKQQRSRWHIFVPILETAFREAMASTNPKLKIGRTVNGPLGRFLFETIPLITGESVTESAIESQIR